MDKGAALAELQQRIREELTCPLKDNAKNLVFGKGNPEASILFIGEAPGEQEDKIGLPFVGRAGQELDKLLHSIGMTLEDCYIANILKYRPPKNRDPTAEEITGHTPYLIEQIKIIQPKIICTLGNYATKFVLAGFDVSGMKHIAGISKLHGQIQHITIKEMSFTVVPLYHPAACLYKPPLRDVLRKDFKTIEAYLKGEVKTLNAFS